MANRTTQGSGDRFPSPGSWAKRSPPTGLPTGSARSKQAHHGATLFAFDRGLGFDLVAGADEAGRGCLAGPLVAAAVLFDYAALDPSEERLLAALDDSKRHTPSGRQQLFARIVEAAAAVGVVSIPAAQIDAEGLHRSNLKALALALERALAGRRGEALCVVDGFALPQLRGPQLPLRGGDRTSAAVAAASIVAKVTRDRHMRQVANRHPQWGFDRHLGYSTPAHRRALAVHGLSPVHRRSFRSQAYQSLAAGV